MAPSLLLRSIVHPPQPCSGVPMSRPCSVISSTLALSRSRAARSGPGVPDLPPPGTKSGIRHMPAEQADLPGTALFRFTGVCPVLSRHVASWSGGIVGSQPPWRISHLPLSACALRRGRAGLVSRRPLQASTAIAWSVHLANLAVPDARELWSLIGRLALHGTECHESSSLEHRYGELARVPACETQPVLPARSGGRRLRSRRPAALRRAGFHGNAALPQRCSKLALAHLKPVTVRILVR